MPPPPGMFWITIVGLPGMCALKYGANASA